MMVHFSAAVNPEEAGYTSDVHDANWKKFPKCFYCMVTLDGLHQHHMVDHITDKDDLGFASVAMRMCYALKIDSSPSSKAPTIKLSNILSSFTTIL